MSEWLNRFRAWFEGLGRREKLLVSAAGGLTLLSLVWVFGVQTLIDARASSRLRASNAEQQLAAVRELKLRFDEVNGRLAGVEQRIAGGPQGNLLATLQDLAQQSAVKVDSIEPRTSPATPPYRETKLQVTLANASLPQVISFLHKIESAPQVLSVKSLKIRTRADQPGMLEVSFTVSSFERA
ncbi:MAG: type II secretion system protein M [Deltaproteobacteria bacterium]|nr:type II secretion system protein M [Deltaproteobacteria bacterium]